MKAMISLLKTGGIVLLMALLFLPVSVCAQSTETLTFTFNMSDFVFETDAQGQVFITSAKHDLVYGDDLAKPAISYRTVSMLAKPDEVYSNVTFSYSGAVKKTNVRLAPNPEKVEVTEEKSGSESVLQLRVASDDMGKVIGKQGRIAKALRTVVKAAATRENRKVSVEIVSENE